MKIGLAAYECKNNDIEFNISQIEKAILEAEKVDILCFGEAFLQGFGAVTSEYKNDIKVAVEQNSKYMNYIKELTTKNQTALMLGYIEKDHNDIYSSYVLIDHGHIVYNYRRMSKNWKEYEKTNEHYKEGVDCSPFIYKGYEMNIALCGDMWIYPEKFKTKGLLIWPVYVNFDLDDLEASEYAKQASTASKNTLLVNSLSKAPLSKGGAFYFKDGLIIKKLKLEKESVLIIEI